MAGEIWYTLDSGSVLTETEVNAGSKHPFADTSGPQ
jgi:hypothetical protein